MELKDTVDLMLSDDWKDRLKAEYIQCLIRIRKLQAALQKNQLGSWEREVLMQQMHANVAGRWVNVRARRRRAMETKKRRCAFCNNAIHEGGSFVAFSPQIKVTINGCTELVRHADFQCHSFPKVFCNWDCFHRFFGAEFIDALPPNPSEWQEEYYDQQFSKYVEID